MTYLERITYLVGEFIELSQYVVKNAYRLNSYLSVRKQDEEFASDRNIIAESIAKKNFQEFIDSKGETLLDFISSSVLSTKDKEKLRSLILKRNFVINNFFIENGYALSKEDIVVYNDIIAQLEEYVNLAKELNVKFANDIAKIDFNK